MWPVAQILLKLCLVVAFSAFAAGGASLWGRYAPSDGRCASELLRRISTAVLSMAFAFWPCASGVEPSSRLRLLSWPNRASRLAIAERVNGIGSGDRPVWPRVNTAKSMALGRRLLLLLCGIACATACAQAARPCDSPRVSGLPWRVASRADVAVATFIRSREYPTEHVRL